MYNLSISNVHRHMAYISAAGVEDQIARLNRADVNRCAGIRLLSCRTRNADSEVRKYRLRKS